MEVIKDARLEGDPETEIEGIEYNSQMLKPNGLFFAVKGFKVDGYDFIDQAKSNGAVAVMGERSSCDRIANHVQVPDIRQAMADVSARFYGYPGLKIKACGVTGTNGKTTTCFMLRKILEARNKITGMISSLEYYTGKEVFPAVRTTPEALDLQRLLFLMKKNFCVNAVIEVSSHAIALKRIENIKFRVVIFTNLTRDHLDFHNSMEEYFNVKASLLKKLNGELDYAVINLDVPEFRDLFGELQSSHISYSIENSQADVYASKYEIKPEGTMFELVTPMGTVTVHLKLPGRFNLINAIAAATGGLACGIDLDTIITGLERMQPIPGRLNRLDVGQPFSIFIDYAHTPDAIARLCENVRDFTEGRLLILFGCGGDRDRGKRPLMGEAASQNADFIMVTSDNPRSEDPGQIIEEIKPGLQGDFEIESDRAQAIEKILKKAQPGDVVLLAGKGAENYQEIDEVKHPFDDTAEAEKVLAELGFRKGTGEEEN